MAKKIAIFVGIIIGTFGSLCLIFFVVFPLKYNVQITKYSKQYNLDAGLVGSLIFAESRYNKNALSSSNACGLMQLMPETYDWVETQLGEKAEKGDIFNPAKNIQFGCYYLRYLFDKYKNEIYVLSCYNAGENVVKKWGDSNNFAIEQVQYAQTKNYVKKILKYKRLYQIRLNI